MEILAQLGLNVSFFFQFVIFAIAYIALSQILFKPYTAAYIQRESRTKGGEEIAQETEKVTQELRKRYESKARNVSTEIRDIFEEQKTLANKEYENIVSAARAESNKLLEDARAKISNELLNAKKQIAEAIPLVSAEMTKKLLSK